MLKNWLKVFLYNTRKNKLFTVLNTLGLSIGIAGIIFALLYWEDENSYEQWNPELENVFQVITDFGDMQISNVPMGLKSHIEEMSGVDCSYSISMYMSSTIKIEEKEFNNKKIFSTGRSFFKLYPFNFLKGNVETCFIPNNSAVITPKIAKTYFGDVNPLGKTFELNNQLYTINGVFEVPGKSGIQPEIITNTVASEVDKFKGDWRTFIYMLWIKIDDKNNVENVKDKFNKLCFKNFVSDNAKKEGITTDEYIKENGTVSFRFSPLKNSRLKESTHSHPEGKGNYQLLVTMLGLSLLILILSIVNSINLATANALKRGKEVGVRKVIGATKLNIVSQFIFETVITMVFTVILALCILEIGLPFFNDFLNKDLTVYSFRFISQIIGVMIVVVLFAGVFPAIYISNFESLKVLKGDFDRSKCGIWLRNGMLILQFAIASFFICGSQIVYEQVNYLSVKDLGLNPNQILDIDFDYGSNDKKVILSKYEFVKNQLKQIKGVEDVSSSSGFNFSGSTITYPMAYKDRNDLQIMLLPSDYNFAKMFEIKLLKGRFLKPEFASDSIDNILINETLMRLMKEKNPVGKILKCPLGDLKIVGVIQDFDLFSPSKEREPIILLDKKSFNWYEDGTRMYVKVASKNVQETITEIEKLWKAKVNQKDVFEFEFVDKIFAETYKEYVQQRNLFGILNVIVILISLFGLFSLASFSIQRNMRTIAIKKTLGAETKTLLFQLSKQYILFCIIGFLIAVFPVIHFLNKWLETFHYRIDISLMPFIIGFVVLLLLTLIIVLGRAYQATKVDVLTYLKHE